LESSESITSPLQPAILQELKKRLFEYNSKGCNIIELVAPSYSLSILLLSKAFDTYIFAGRALGAGTVIVLAGPREFTLGLLGLPFRVLYTIHRSS
jgi:hypothetical protein